MYLLLVAKSNWSAFTVPAIFIHFKPPNDENIFPNTKINGNREIYFHEFQNLAMKIVIFFENSKI